MRFGATIPLAQAQEQASEAIEITIRQMEELASRAGGASAGRVTDLLTMHIGRMNSYLDQIEAATSTVTVDRLKNEALSVARSNLAAMQSLVGGPLPPPPRDEPSPCQPAGTVSSVSFGGRIYRLQATGRRTSAGYCTFIDLDTREEIVLTPSGRSVVDRTPAPIGQPRPTTMGSLLGALLGGVMVGGATWADHRRRTRV